MISNGASAAIARAISPTRAATLPASLRTGTTTEIRGATPDCGGLALVIDPSGLDPARVLWGDQRPGNPFDPVGRRTREHVHRAVHTHDEAQATAREPIAHPQRTERTDRGSRNHVARIMRDYHDPAQGDEEGVAPQERTRAGKHRA